MQIPEERLLKIFVLASVSLCQIYFILFQVIDDADNVFEHHLEAVSTLTMSFRLYFNLNLCFNK